MDDVPTVNQLDEGSILILFKSKQQHVRKCGWRTTDSAERRTWLPTQSKTRMATAKELVTRFSARIHIARITADQETLVVRTLTETRFLTGSTGLGTAELTPAVATLGLTLNTAVTWQSTLLPAGVTTHQGSVTHLVTLSVESDTITLVTGTLALVSTGQHCLTPLGAHLLHAQSLLITLDHFVVTAGHRNQHLNFAPSGGTGCISAVSSTNPTVLVKVKVLTGMILERTYMAHL